MTEQSWTFPEEPWYDSTHRAIKFAAISGADRHVCAISTIAINDKFQTEDTSEAAMQNYLAHSNWVHSLAVRLIEHGQPNPDGFYLITSEIVKNG